MENWSEISNNINNIKNSMSKKFEDEVKDREIKESLNDLIDDVKILLNDVVEVFETTVKDETIKNESKEIIIKIKSEFSELHKVVFQNKNEKINAYEEE